MLPPTPGLTWRVFGVSSRAGWHTTGQAWGAQPSLGPPLAQFPCAYPLAIPPSASEVPRLLVGLPWGAVRAPLKSVEAIDGSLCGSWNTRSSGACWPPHLPQGWGNPIRSPAWVRAYPHGPHFSPVRVANGVGPDQAGESLSPCRAPPSEPRTVQAADTGAQTVPKPHLRCTKDRPLLHASTDQTPKTGPAVRYGKSG